MTSNPDPPTVVPTARDRWKILRQAILRSQQGKENDVVPGLHSFPGYQLLVRQQPQGKESVSSDWLDLMQRSYCQVELHSDVSKTLSVEALMQLLEDCYLGCQALCNTNNTNTRKAGTDTTITLQLSILPENNTTSHVVALNEFWLDQTTRLLEQHQTQLEAQLKEVCHLESCHLSWEGRQEGTTATDNGNNITMQLQLQTTRSGAAQEDVYQVPVYGIASSNSADHQSLLYIRERMSRRRFSLQELMNTKSNSNASNTSGQGIDNTGNVCVWDSEKTLTWALRQHHNQQEQGQQDVVLELGIGMAGLAGLYMAQSGRAKHVILTDGHEKCVQNNRINVRLQQSAYKTTNTMTLSSSASQKRPCPVDCQLLLWTLEADDIPTPLLDRADLTLISDCTHFEHYHGHLLWTLLSCTKSKTGQVWMCQPDRGQSWQRFCNLMDAVNEASENEEAGPLVSVQEQTFSLLEELHQNFLANKTNNNDASFYRPNVHRPRIVVLSKLRDVSETDRQAILRHLTERDQNRRAAHK